MFRFRLITVVAILAISFAADGRAQSDALATCIADNTSGRDRKDLATWMFLAMAAHPEIKPYLISKASEAADESARKMAALVTRLLTDSCVKEVKALTKEGPAAFRAAFERLGALAMQELMADKSVTESFGLIERYLDQKRFEGVFGK